MMSPNGYNSQIFQTVFSLIEDHFKSNHPLAEEWHLTRIWLDEVANQAFVNKPLLEDRSLGIICQDMSAPVWRALWPHPLNLELFEFWKEEECYLCGNPSAMRSE